jgi:transcriptional regulator with XRE-family HTH domain
MREPIRGQRSHNAGDDRTASSALHWRDVAAGTVWAFTVDLCARHGYRKAAEKTGVSKAALQKYVQGLTRPNLSTRQLLGEYFLQSFPGGMMQKKDINGDWDVRPRLIELLPGSEMRARREMKKLFDLARRFPDEVPGFVDQVETWIDLQIRGEWWAERKHSSPAVREREWNRESKALQSRLQRLMKLVKAEEAAEREAKRKAREEAARLPPEDEELPPAENAPQRERGARRKDDGAADE